MARIDIKGDIVINEFVPFYRWLGWDCISPGIVNDIIAEASDDEDIDVYINSGGGHVQAGQEIYSALRENPRTHIHVQGMACSAASIIAMAGKSEISPVGMLMIHNVSGGASGDYHEMDKAKRELQTMNEALASAYVEKTGMDSEALLKLMDKETWLTANQCVEMGFIDQIEAPAVNSTFAVNTINSGIRLTDELMQEVKAKMQAEKENADIKNQLIEDLDEYGV